MPGISSSAKEKHFTASTPTPPPHCPWEHTIIFKKSDIFRKKFGFPQLHEEPSSLSALGNPLIAGVFYEQLLICYLILHLLVVGRKLSFIEFGVKIDG